LDDLRAQASEWCDQAQRLCGEPEASPVENLPGWLDAIEAGLRLRRQLDGLGQESAIESNRREVVRRLAELQVLAEAGMERLEAGSPNHQLVAARAKDGLTEARVAVRNVLSGLRLGPIHQAMSIESLRTDLEWLSTLVARVDGEEPHPVTAWLDVELERLRTWLRTPQGRVPEPPDMPVVERCERVRAKLLERRIERELARQSVGWSADGLWAERFHLSRLQTQVETLELEEPGRTRGGEVSHETLREFPRFDTHPDRDDSPCGDGPDEWQSALKCRRIELADEAVDRLAGLDVQSRAEAGERIVQSAVDEVSETIAFLEDMPLRSAVKRLNLMRDDLQVLTESCQRWLREAKADRPPVPDTNFEAEAGQDDLTADRVDEDDEASAARYRLRRQLRRARRLSRQIRAAWQEKLLALRMERLLGRKFVSILETTVLVLILVLFVMIAAQVVMEGTSPKGLSIRQHEFFAWVDLGICSVFLLEFALKLALAPHRFLYFARHFVIDFVASLPYGFVFHQIAVAQIESAGAAVGAGAGAFRPLIRAGRIALRFIRIASPILRLIRIPLILLRLSDRLVRRMAGLLNRNIVLFEPQETQKAESSDRHHLVTLRSELEHANNAIEARLDRDQRRQIAERILLDLEQRIDGLPAPEIDEAVEPPQGREIPVEKVVERLIQMTPERLLDRAGPAFVRTVDRYLRLLDLPFVRRLPVIRNLVAYREKSPAEAVALAANYLGHLIQRGLNVVYFFADLHGTLSPPVFLDRLGATLVNATRTPAKRLLWLGSVFFFLFLIVNTLAFLKPLRGVVDKLQTLMGWPVIILGAICLIFWYLGAWFRKIANQSADFCERVVEAQFAAHTKNLKSRRRDQDAQFLTERVIDPELRLRAADDRPCEPIEHGDEDGDRRGPDLFQNRELAFLRNVRLLYQDYLDGSPLHRSDTKASVQLLGNLALGNLRRSHLGHLLREGRSIDRLDLNRAGGLFGGAYLWFNYITRLLVQETALLILDYNRNAVPVDRLACSPEPMRRAFQHWLAGRLKVEPDDIWLPDVPTAGPNGQDVGPATAQETAPVPKDRTVPLRPSPRREAGLFLETVEFTAVDFLADEPDRDAEIHARFGPQVAELVRRDRQQNVRRAFRSFPLHELPLASRTINPYASYEAHLAGGRIVLLPFTVARALGWGGVLAIRGIYRVVREILHPHVDRQQIVPSDTYWAALRKIHRMRKPVFMGSLWLRARFDVEYLGIPLPTAPASIAAPPLMETDLDYIGATRQDRIIAEQVRLQHQERLEWIVRWLDRFGWTFDELPTYLAREIPFLANRGGEALRALVAACILDHNDIATLALSIGGLKRVMAHAADSGQDFAKLPGGLPDPVINLRRLWHPVSRCKRLNTELFDLPCFPAYNPAQRRRIVRYLRRHRRVVRGWIKVVLGQGELDPWATVKARMRDVLLRTDLWSDQILVLRAVQSLTMLDLQHNCELVWKLGGYTRPEPGDAEPDAAPPRRPLHQDDRAVSASR
jgi:hypothetical protein